MLPGIIHVKISAMRLHQKTLEGFAKLDNTLLKSGITWPVIVRQLKGYRQGAVFRGDHIRTMLEEQSFESG